MPSPIEPLIKNEVKELKISTVYSWKSEVIIETKSEAAIKAVTTIAKKPVEKAANTSRRSLSSANR